MNIFRILLLRKVQLGLSIQNADKKFKLNETETNESESDITTHETDEFTEEVDCKADIGCITQPLSETILH
jgi:hypothetical protein